MTKTNKLNKFKFILIVISILIIFNAGVFLNKLIVKSTSTNSFTNSLDFRDVQTFADNYFNKYLESQNIDKTINFEKNTSYDTRKPNEFYIEYTYENNQNIKETYNFILLKNENGITVQVN